MSCLTALDTCRSPIRVHSISPPPASVSQVVLFYDLAAVFNSVVLMLFSFICSNLLSFVFMLSSSAFVSIYYVIFSIVAGHQFSSAGIFAQGYRTVDSACFSQVLIVARVTRRWPLAVCSDKEKPCPLGVVVASAIVIVLIAASPSLSLSPWILVAFSESIFFQLVVFGKFDSSRSLSSASVFSSRSLSSLSVGDCFLLTELGFVARLEPNRGNVVGIALAFAFALAFARHHLEQLPRTDFPAVFPRVNGYGSVRSLSCSGSLVSSSTSCSGLRAYHPSISYILSFGKMLDDQSFLSSSVTLLSSSSSSSMLSWLPRSVPSIASVAAQHLRLGGHRGERVGEAAHPGPPPDRAPRHDAILRRTRRAWLPRSPLPDRAASNTANLDFVCRLCEIDGGLEARAVYQCFICESYLCTVHAHDFRAMRGTSWRGFRWGYCFHAAFPSGHGPLRCCRPVLKAFTDPALQGDALIRARQRSRLSRLVDRVPETDEFTVRGRPPPRPPMDSLASAPQASASEIPYMGDSVGVPGWVHTRRWGLIPDRSGRSDRSRSRRARRSRPPPRSPSHRASS